MYRTCTSIYAANTINNRQFKMNPWPGFASAGFTVPLQHSPHDIHSIMYIYYVYLHTSCLLARYLCVCMYVFRGRTSLVDCQFSDSSFQQPYLYNTHFHPFVPQKLYVRTVQKTIYITGFCL